MKKTFISDAEKRLFGDDSSEQLKDYKSKEYSYSLTNNIHSLGNNVSFAVKSDTYLSSNSLETSIQGVNHLAKRFYCKHYKRNNNNTENYIEKKEEFLPIDYLQALGFNAQIRLRKKEDILSRTLHVIVISTAALEECRLLLSGKLEESFEKYVYQNKTNEDCFKDFTPLPWVISINGLTFAVKMSLLEE